MREKEIIYCSLDIETSGFDPLKEEILEVGFVLFNLGKSDGSENRKIGNPVKVIEEWTQVFKPTKIVEPKILGLTGIKQEELDTAPNFSEFKDIIQEKVRDAVIVGHNINFDIKFLEARGIKFSGRTIDTLDLVQWLLPTHHSYNLENLMHYFGINHQNAHRALADAKASLEVLKRLLGVFANFDSKLQEKINKIIKNQDFEWLDLLSASKSFKNLLGRDNKANKIIKTSKNELKLDSKVIYNFKTGLDPAQEILPALQTLRKKSLLVLPKKQSVIKLCKELGLSAVWHTDQLFEEKKFNKFLKKSLSSDEAKFALKVLVWQATNWQTEALIDLNLSFFGGQFKQEITGGAKQDYSKTKILVCDIFTFLHLKDSGDFSDRQIVFVGLAEFENAISLNLSDRVAWGQLNYQLKSIYNPELNIGDASKKELVEELLNASDLFFGLVSALLQTDPPSFLDVAITEDFKAGQAYAKIKQASESFWKKLKSVSEKSGFENFGKASQNLAEFFNDEPNRVKWLELSDKRCIFNNAPLKIDSVAKKIFVDFPNTLFVDALSPKEVVKYFLDRLGLETWEVKKVVSKDRKPWDLFRNLKKIKFHLKAESPDIEKIKTLIQKNDLPAAVLFGAPKNLREFYDQSYKELKTYATLLSQGGSGSNKLFNNFGISKNALLLATDRTILKALANVAENSRPPKLYVKTLIILRLPFDPVSHPYNQALAQTYPNSFVAMAMPKALHNLHQLMSLFYTNELKNVYLYDQKLSKEYTKPFYSYFDELG